MELLQRKCQLGEQAYKNSDSEEQKVCMYHGEVQLAWGEVEGPLTINSEYLSFHACFERRTRRKAICEEIEKTMDVPKIIGAGQSLSDLRKELTKLIKKRISKSMLVFEEL